MVQELFAQSGSSNLRLIEQALWSFERAYFSLKMETRANVAAMQALLRVHLIAFVEHRSGKLSEHSIRLRAQIPYLGLSDDRHTDLKEVVARYAQADFDDAVVSGDTLADIVVHGKIDPDSIEAGIFLSSYFERKTEQPAWLRLWNMRRNSASENEAALGEVISRLENDEIAEAGELYHVAGLLLHLAGARILRRSVNSVVNELKSHVRRALKRNLLEPMSVDISHEDARYGSWKSHGFFGRESAEFGQIYSFINEARHQALQNTFEVRASNLMSVLASNVSAFCRLLWDHSDNNELVQLPILTRLSPAKFADAVLSKDAEEQFEIMKALGMRLDAQNIVNFLEPEVPWAEKVGSVVKSRAHRMRAFDRHRVTDNWDGLVATKIQPFTKDISKP